MNICVCVCVCVCVCMYMYFGRFSSSWKVMKNKICMKKKGAAETEMGYCPIVSRYNGNCIVTWWFWKAGLAGEKAMSRYKYCIVTEAA